MEAQQCVKLSLTNRSIGLIPLRSPQRERQGELRNTSRPAINPDALPPGKASMVAERNSGRFPKGNLRSVSRRETSADFRNKTRHAKSARKRFPCLDDLVAMARGQTPDPIPNSAVKTLSADGTAS